MKRIYIFSYGLYPGQITLETLAAMKNCGAVYTHSLDKETARQFSRLTPRLNLTAGLDRKAAAAAVSALAKYDTVGFLTYGNPLFLNKTAAEIQLAAAARKAETVVLSGVSSFDALVNLFGLNKFSPGGLRLLDSAAFIGAPTFTPDMDTLVFVPYVLNLPANGPARKKLIYAARRAYPPSAPAYLADCASISCRVPKVTKGSIRDLGALLKKVNERHTLFIPAAARKNKDRLY